MIAGRKLEWGKVNVAPRDWQWVSLGSAGDLVASAEQRGDQTANQLTARRARRNCVNRSEKMTGLGAGPIMDAGV